MEAESHHRRHPSRHARSTGALLFGVGLLAAMLCCLAMASPALAATLGKPVAKAPLGTVTTVKPTFTWSGVSGARTYEVRIYKGRKLLLDKARLVKTSWKCAKGLPLYIKLHWKVRAVGSRSPGPWSKSVAFKVDPNTPQGTTTVLQPTFAWAKAAGATRYELRVYRGAKLLIAKTQIKGTSWKCTALPPSHAALTWKVRGSKAHRLLRWSKTFHFMIAAPPARIVDQAGDAQSAVAGSAPSVLPSVLVSDAKGRPVPGASVTFAVASGGGAVTGATAVTNASGLATVGSWTLGTRAGADSLTATCAGLAPVTFHATGVAGPADAATSTLSPTSPSLSADGSSTQTLTVQVRDAYGNDLTSGGDIVTITGLSGSGTIGPVVDNHNGSYSATVTAPTATGSGVFVATLNGDPVEGGGAAQSQATVSYVPGPLAKFAVSIAGQTAGVAFSGTNTVTAEDAYGNTITSFDASADAVTISAAPNNGTISGLGSLGGNVLDRTLDFTNGVASLTGTMVFAGTAGSHTFSATAGLCTGTSQSVTVNPGSATQLTLSGLTSQTAGSAQSLTVTAQDAYGNTATGYRGTVQFSSSDGAAALPASYTFVAGDSGAHTFTSGVTLKTAGSQTVTASDTASGTITGSQSTTVSPGSATTLALSGLTSQTAGSAQSLTVTAQDAYGNTATGYRGTVQLSSSDGAAALPASYTFVAGDSGAHSFTSGVTLKTAGSQTVTAADTASGTITGTESVAVSAGSATHLTIETAANGSGTAIGAQGVTAGSSFTAYAITRDAYGNFVANASATWSLTNTSGAVAASDLSSTSGASTVFTGHLVGSATLHAAVGSLTADSGTVTVSPGSATQLVLSGLTSQTAGSAQSLTVTAQDAYGNTASGYRGTVQFSSSDGAAALPASYTFQASDGGVHSFSGVTLKTAGSQTVTASDTASGTITGTESVTVSTGGATQLTIETAANGTGTAIGAKNVTCRVELHLLRHHARRLRQLRGQPERHLEPDRHQRRGRRERPEHDERRLDRLHRPPRRQRHPARRSRQPHGQHRHRHGEPGQRHPARPVRPPRQLLSGRPHGPHDDRL